MILTIFILLKCVAVFASFRPLEYVPGMYTPMSINKNGVYKKHIDHVDIFGGHTFLKSHVELHQDSFVNLDEVEEAGLSFVSCTSDEVILQHTDAAARTPRFGAILVGAVIEHCCSPDAQRDSVLQQVCARQVSSVVRIERSDLPDLYRFQVVDVDIKKYIKRLEFKMTHNPGNKTQDEAMVEARKRGWTDINVPHSSKRFSIADFNYDSPGKAKREISLYKPGFIMGPRSKCMTCYTRLGITIESELVFEQSGVDGKQNLHAKAAFGLDAGIGAVVRWDFNALARIAYSYKLFESPKAYLAFPVGPLAVTFSTKFVFSLEARIQIKQPLVITTGITAGFSGKIGAQLDNTRLTPISSLRFDATLPIGPVERPPNTMEGELLAGVATKIQTEVGVTLAALIAFKNTGPKLMQFELLIARPQVRLGFDPLPGKNCQGYSLTWGVGSEVNIDLLPSLSIKKSGRHEVKAIGGTRFQPFKTVWDPVPSRSPANCEWCRRCLVDLTETHNIIEPAITDRSQDPPPAIPYTPRLIVSVDETEYVVGGTIHVEFEAERPGTIAPSDEVLVALEYRANAENYPEVYEDVIEPKGTRAVKVQDGELFFDARAFIAAPTITLTEPPQVRVLVASKQNSLISGRSEWMTIDHIADQYNTNVLRPYYAYEAYPTECEAACGANAIQRRAVKCVDWRYQTLDDSECEKEGDTKKELQRRCGDLMCKYEPFEVRVLPEGVSPTDEEIDDLTPESLEGREFTTRFRQAKSAAGYAKVNVVLSYGVPDPSLPVSIEACVEIGRIPIGCPFVRPQDLGCAYLADVATPEVPGQPTITPVEIELDQLGRLQFGGSPFYTPTFLQPPPSVSAAVRFLIRQGSHVTLSSVFTINAPSEYHFEPTLQSGEQFEVFGTFGSVSGPQLGPVLSSELRDVGQVHEVYVSQSYTQRVGNRSSLVITRNDYVQVIPLEFRFTSVKNGGMSGVVCDGFSCRSEHNPYPLFEGWVRCALQPFGVWQLRDGEVRLPDSASTLLLSFTVICIATVISLI